MKLSNLTLALTLLLFFQTNTMHLSKLTRLNNVLRSSLRLSLLNQSQSLLGPLNTSKIPKRYFFKFSNKFHNSSQNQNKNYIKNGSNEVTFAYIFGYGVGYATAYSVSGK